MNAFVLVVCGDEHIPWAKRCLRHIKHFTNNNVIVVASRITERFHDDIIEIKLPESFDDLLGSRHLKASLCEIIKPAPGDVYCYLDNDVLAVDDASLIFDYISHPISFATDHVSTVSLFSPWAVEGNLVEALKMDFGVEVDVDWSLWNGGLFLFGKESHEFLDLWRSNIHKVFENPKWKNRDQGALIAAVWQLKLQNHPRIPKEFNWIVDHTNLDGSEGQPRLLHFIHKEDHRIFNEVTRKIQ
jgi:hypothetical protein